MAKVEIEVKEGKKLIISEGNINKGKFRFVAMGLTMLDDKHKEIVLAKVMQDLGFNANWLLWCLIEARDYNTNKSKFISTDLSAAMKKRIVRGYEELLNKKLVKRIRPMEYMINPDFILPNLNNYTECKAEWDNKKKVERNE